ncbi:hypothetical protein ABZ297_17830 [Nonomuraea sp. NPDC005983]|uniref:hypothetical protein n=1 Tax=Nonomuraea sp. NPDC005983 TaxID=3155595 RepID=UPI0033A8C9FE
MNLTGVLFSPITPFDKAGGLAEDVLAEHVSRGLGLRPPLVDAIPEHVAELDALIRHGRSLAGSHDS